MILEKLKLDGKETVRILHITLRVDRRRHLKIKMHRSLGTRQPLTPMQYKIQVTIATLAL